MLKICNHDKELGQRLPSFTFAFTGSDHSFTYMGVPLRVEKLVLLNQILSPDRNVPGLSVYSRTKERG